jgi:hypothetical protein
MRLHLQKFSAHIVKENCLFMQPSLVGLNRLIKVECRYGVGATTQMTMAEETTAEVYPAAKALRSRRLRRAVSRILGMKAALLIVALLAQPNVAGAQTAAANYCPPDGTSIALFARQAFDEGRATAGRQYAKFLDELVQLAMSNAPENEVVEQSVDASRRFAAAMVALGHEMTVGDIGVHREAQLIVQVGIARQSITKARACHRPGNETSCLQTLSVWSFVGRKKWSIDRFTTC